MAKCQKSPFQQTSVETYTCVKRPWTTSTWTTPQGLAVDQEVHSEDEVHKVMLSLGAVIGVFNGYQELCGLDCWRYWFNKKKDFSTSKQKDSRKLWVERRRKPLLKILVVKFISWTQQTGRSN